MSNTSNQYAESLFDSVNILINKSLENVSYDTTIICTIVDDSNSKNGEYKVTDGSVTYTAYADNNKYLKGDQVRVSVPMGNLQEQKFIVGKYASDNDTNPITYISPDDTILNITGNLISSSNINGGIVANGSDTLRVLWNDSDVEDSFKAMQDSDIYNTVILKANFRTSFRNSDMVSGNYGLRIDFKVRPSAESGIYLRRSVELDCSEMFGNPYNFSIKSPQAKIFKINTIGIIEAMELSLYQKGNFITRNNGALKVIKDRDNNEVDNIFVTDIVLGFGSDLAAIEDNSLQIYTSDSPFYLYGKHNNSTNKKNIGLLWYNKDENNKYIGFSDGVYQSDYDELVYLNEAKLDSRLTAQKGKEFIPEDKISLNLAANLEEALPKLNKAIDVVNQDLIQLLRELQTRVSDVADYNTNINRLISMAEPESGQTDYRLVKMTQDIETLIGADSADKGLVPQYKAVLKYGYQIWKNLTPDPAWSTEANTLWPNYTGSSDYVEQNNYNIQIRQKFNSIQSAIDWLFDTGFTGINGTYSGYKSIYDAYKLRVTRLMATMWGYLGRAEIKFGVDYASYDKCFPQSILFATTDTDLGYNGTTDFAFLYNYKNKAKESYSLYRPVDLSMYDNRYCIYWYRYEQGYIPPNNEQILPNGWRRLTSEDLKTEPHSVIGDSDGKNVGLSSIYYYDDDSDLKYRYKKTSVYNTNRKYYSKSTVNGKDQYNLVLNPTKANVQAAKYYARVCINNDGKWVHAPKVKNGNGLISRYMQNDLTQEKYMAVLFYNHNMYKSNELIFTNSEVVPDKTTLDKGDILIFEHLTNSSDSFQLYGITNYLMDMSDETKLRQIRCHYDGLLAKDNAFIGGSIYWYVPNVSTMLSVDVDDLINNKGFVIDAARSEYGYEEIPLTESIFNRKEKDYYTRNNDGSYSKASLTFNSSKVYYQKIYTTYCFYKIIEGYKKSDNEITDEMFEWDKWNYHKNGETIDNRDFWYTIKGYYQPEDIRNEITCVFVQSEDVDEVQGIQLFTFGLKGTSGTKYTLSIVKDGTQITSTSSMGLPLKITLKDFDNNELSLTENVEDFDVEWEAYNKITGNETSDIQDLACSKFATLKTPPGYFGILKATARIMLVGTMIQSDKVDISQTDDATSVGKTRSVDMTTLYAIPYSNGNCFIDGPTQIIYNSLGTLDNNSIYNVPYRLLAKKQMTIKVPKSYSNATAFNNDTAKKWYANNNSYVENGNEAYNKDRQYFIEKTFNKDNIIPEASWDLIYYKKSGKEWSVCSAAEKEACLGYLPTLQKGNLVPRPLYIANNNEYYVVVRAKVGLTTYWRQPILILQNRYASNMLNDWDGSLTIDEKNGTILSSMVGAGRKNDDNQFEGVLMGDVGLGSGAGVGFENGANIGLSNQTGLGIYGFHEGAQSFGFNVDGTAFLGKSGSGRIIFNGNSGTIASSNWFTGSDTITTDINGNHTYPNGGVITNGKITRSSDDGMCIDLDNGQIDAYNFKLTSKNIYLNSNPVDGHSHIINSKDRYSNYYLRIGENNKTGFIGLDTDGRLEMRVNSMQLTAQIGNENLLMQTSPRQSVVVPHWIKYYYIKSAEIDNNGTIENVSQQEIGYQSYDHDEDGKYHYTWNVKPWTNSFSSDISSWERSKSYLKDDYVKRLGNLWKATAAVAANELPPGNTGSKWAPQVEVIDDDSKLNIISIKGDNIQLYQTMTLKNNTKYTVSAYVRSTVANKKLGFILGSNNQYVIDYSFLDEDETYPTDETMLREWTLTDTNWHYIQCTFITPNSTTNTEDTRRVGFTCEAPFQFWHAKLEKGSIATTWNPSPKDVEDNVESATTQFDYYLNQDATFDKLFKDKKTGLYADGIQLIKAEESVTGLPELYINASYIATGILRSKNWDGKIKVARENADDPFEYTISKNPTAGMYMDLNNGKLWAAKFELNAWDYDNTTREDKGNGLYLNSDPSLSTNLNHQYYLKLGDLQKSYITFDALGNLNMKVNSFELTSVFGGTNLLNDTAPRGAATSDKPVPIRNARSNPPAGAHWKYNDNYIIAVAAISSEKGKSIRISNKSTLTDNYRHIYQEIEPLRQADKYILSGWVYIPSSKNTIIFRIRPVIDDQSADYKKYVQWDFKPTASGWQYISHIFDIAEKGVNFSEPRFQIIDYNITEFNNDTDKTVKANNYTWFHHLKLEQGTVATQWEESEQDKLDTLEIYDTEQLLQDAIFNKLTDNGAAKGIFLKDGDLYINATYLASSIIRSSEWKATYKLKDSAGNDIKNGSNDRFNQNQLATVLENYPDAKIYDIQPTDGMYINLDDGKIWSKNFELDAAKQSTNSSGVVTIKGVYINNNPVAPEEVDLPTNKLTKNSYYFRIGSDNNNYIGFAKTKVTGTNGTAVEGTDFTIKSKTFNLQAGTIEYDDENNSINKEIKINSSATTYPLQIGAKFKVKWDGSLTAKDATFQGNIESSATIKGGNIEGAAIKGGTITGSSIQIPGGETPLFTVNSLGEFTATKGSIGGWEITRDALSGNGVTLGSSGISSGYWNVGENGITTIKDLTVTNSLTVNYASTETRQIENNIQQSRAVFLPSILDGAGGGNGTPPAAMVSIAGNTSIAGNLTISSKTLLKGDTQVQGSLFMGSATSGGDGSADIVGASGAYISFGSATSKESKIGIWVYGGISLSGEVQIPVETYLVVSDKARIKIYDYLKGFSSYTSEDGETTFNVPAKAAALTHNGYTITLKAPKDAADGVDYALVSTDKNGGSAWKELGALAFVDDIKKKFKITISGATGGTASTYYTINSTYYNNYSAGSTATLYFWYDLNEHRYKSDTTAPNTSYCYGGTYGQRSYTAQGTYRGTLYSVDSVSVGGSKNISLTATTEVTLGPNSGAEVEEITLSLDAD